MQVDEKSFVTWQICILQLEKNIREEIGLKKKKLNDFATLQ